MDCGLTGLDAEVLHSAVSELKPGCVLSATYAHHRGTSSRAMSQECRGGYSISMTQNVTMQACSLLLQLLFSLLFVHLAPFFCTHVLQKKVTRISRIRHFCLSSLVHSSYSTFHTVLPCQLLNCSYTLGTSLRVSRRLLASGPFRQADTCAHSNCRQETSLKVPSHGR